MKIINPFIWLWNVFKYFAALGDSEETRMEHNPRKDDTSYFS